MKKILLMAAMLGTIAGIAQAQSNVTVYGLIDTGIEHVTNVGASGSGVTRMPGITGSKPSRLGFNGEEDLGGGLKTVLTIETGFSPDQGSLNQASRMFGRQAYVGLAGPWGTISLGRQYSQIYWSLTGDTMGPNIYAAGLLDGYLANSRLDNAIAYRGTFNGFTIGATYSLGRDAVATAPAGGCAGEAPGDARACRDISGMLKYDAASWGGAVSFETQYGGAGSASPLPLSSQKDTRSIINGYVNVAKSTIGAGWVHRKNDGSITPTSNYWFLGGSVPVSAFVFDLQYGRITFSNSANAASVIAARALYYLSKRTAVYFTAGQVRNKGGAAYTIDGGVTVGAAPLPGQGQTGTMVGMRHTF